MEIKLLIVTAVVVVVAAGLVLLVRYHHPVMSVGPHRRDNPSRCGALLSRLADRVTTTITIRSRAWSPSVSCQILVDDFDLGRRQVLVDDFDIGAPSKYWLTTLRFNESGQLPFDRSAGWNSQVLVCASRVSSGVAAFRSRSASATCDPRSVFAKLLSASS
jgi:hypothetical protein